MFEFCKLHGFQLHVVYLLVCGLLASMKSLMKKENDGSKKKESRGKEAHGNAWISSDFISTVS